MLFPRHSILIFTVLTILVSGLCSAHETMLAEQGTWDPVTAGPFVTWTAPLCGKKTFAVQPYLIYDRARGTFDGRGHFQSLASNEKRDQYVALLFLQYGFTNKLELDVQSTVQYNHAEQGGAQADSNGLGDSFVFLRYCAWEQNGWRPHVTGVLQVKVPTGKFEHADPDKIGTDLRGAATGGGSWDPGLGLIATKNIKPFILHADASYSVPQEVKVDDVNTRYGSYLNYDVGLEYVLAKGFNLMLEANGLQQREWKESGRTVADSGVGYLVVSPGVGWSNERIQTLVGYQRVVAGANVDALDSVVLTAVFNF